MSVKERLIAALEERAASNAEILRFVAAGINDDRLAALRDAHVIISRRVSVLSETMKATIRAA